MKNKKVYGAVCPVVFYYKSTESELKSFFRQDRNEFNYVLFWAKDSENILSDIKNKLRTYNRYFTSEMYQQVSALFKPSLERMEQEKPFILSKGQKKFTVSQKKKRQKIKGVAGSGKTLVLAQRAENCFQRTRSIDLYGTYSCQKKFSDN